MGPLKMSKKFMSALKSKVGWKDCWKDCSKGDRWKDHWMEGWTDQRMDQQTGYYRDAKTDLKKTILNFNNNFFSY